MKRRLLIANWKMNLPSEGIASFVETTGDGSDEVEIVVAPPFPFLPLLSAEIGRRGRIISAGAQNCSDREEGAFTGEVSTRMLRQLGVRFVIAGHSERRGLFGEDDRFVGRKVRRALDEQLEPVLCIGEEQQVRDAGGTEALLRRQLEGAFEEIGEAPERLIVAYEPVWAIGTGQTATPQLAAETHRQVRTIVAGLAPEMRLTILYGGSVTAENAADLAAEEEIDGFLVGGASLKSQKFDAILTVLKAAARMG